MELTLTHPHLSTDIKGEYLMVYDDQEDTLIKIKLNEEQKKILFILAKTIDEDGIPVRWES